MIRDEIKEEIRNGNKIRRKQKEKRKTARTEVRRGEETKTKRGGEETRKGNKRRGGDRGGDEIRGPGCWFSLALMFVLSGWFLLLTQAYIFYLLESCLPL